MAKVLTMGPNRTPVEGITSLALSQFAPLNFVADFRAIEEGPGKVVLADVTTPVDQPSTLRIAQQSKPNVYAGTSIDPSAYLPNRKGVDTIVELKQVWAITDSEDASYLRHVPVRCAITLSLPTTSVITSEDVETLVCRTIAGMFAHADDEMDAGINALLHGVVSKG